MLHAHAHAHFDPVDTDLIDPDTDAFLRGLKKQSAWWLCPYGAWTERNGAGVIFDRKYRPIVRVYRGGLTEIVPPDELIPYRRQRFFHGGFGWSPDAETREIVTQIIAKYGLAPELRRRLELLRLSELRSVDLETLLNAHRRGLLGGRRQ